MIQVTIFNEFVHERTDEEVREIYPQGIHVALATALSQESDINARTATLQEPEQLVTADVLAATDVLLWWGHLAHDQVADDIVDRVQARVLEGMGLIVLHSGHHSKIFRRLMGTSCSLLWREADEKERLWVVNASHPITEGIGPFIELPQAEMYGEIFDVPDPDELLFISWFAGGNVFRSGATWHRGRGRIFYFRPGHETYPVFYQPDIQRVLINAVRWATFRGNTEARGIGEAINVPEPLEPLSNSG